MELTRRGIFGLLGGALLAKVVGPQLIAAPTPKLWEAAKVLPARPIINTYVPLQYVCAETLRIVDKELKWLRLQRYYCSQTKLGDHVQFCQPVRFVPQTDPLYDEGPFMRPIVERYRPVILDSTVTAHIDLSELDPDCPFGELSVHYIEPLAHALAERVIRGIRRKGGGEALATGRLEVPDGVDRCVLAHNDDSGLGLRAIQSVCPGGFGAAYWRPILRIDMLYGVG